MKITCKRYPIMDQNNSTSNELLDMKIKKYIKIDVLEKSLDAYKLFELNLKLSGFAIKIWRSCLACRLYYK